MTLDERVELSELFDKYKNFLTQTQRQALHLYLLEDLGKTEIANELATTRQAINDAIGKGIKKLKKIDDNII